MTMKQIFRYITLAMLAAASLAGCKEHYVTYEDAERCRTSCLGFH